MSTQETALTVSQMAALPIKDPQTLASQIAKLSETAIVLSPVTQVTNIAAKHQVALSVVSINPWTDDYGSGPECYVDRRFCFGDEVAPGKNALLKVMRAAGIQQVANTRQDDRSDPFFCEIQMTLGVREYTGEWHQEICTRALDLRDSMPETLVPERDSKKKKTGRMIPLKPSALADARRHIVSLCETKCLERGIRQILSLQQKYSAKVLKTKPFVIPKLVMDLDPDDPDDKRALIAMATGALGAIGQPADAKVSSVSRSQEPEPGTAVVDMATGEVLKEPEPDDPADFGDLPEPEPEKPEHICTCECGHQAELSEEVAKLTRQKVGKPRCKLCFPGRSFDFDLHADLPGGKLGLSTKEHGTITVDMVKGWLA